VISRVDVLPAAEQDIADAVAWYDARSPTLGDRLDELDATMTRIRDRPMIFRAVHGPVRRVAVHVFPSFVWFLVEEGPSSRTWSP
jgi:hypothetical protein